MPRLPWRGRVSPRGVLRRVRVEYTRIDHAVLLGPVLHSADGQGCGRQDVAFKFQLCFGYVRARPAAQRRLDRPLRESHFPWDQLVPSNT